MSDYNVADYTAQVETASEQFLTTLAKAQDDFAQAVASFVKNIPSIPAIPGLPEVDLTAPSEITAVSFDFAEKLLAQNRTHTDRVFAALAPVAV